MVSASKAARQAKREADGKPAKKTAGSKLASKSGSDSPLFDADGQELNDDGTKAIADKVKKLELQEDKDGLSDRVTTGVLSSLKTSRDVKITSASLVFHGKVLFNDTTLEINYARRYGLLGENGCGKSTLLKAIDRREFPFPDHVDIYLLNEGAPLTDLGALEWVVKQAQDELARLEKQSEEILENEGPDAPILEEIYEVFLNCFCFCFFSSSLSPSPLLCSFGQSPHPPLLVPLLTLAPLSAWKTWTPRPSRHVLRSS